MNVKIEINCNSPEEVYTHLRVIRSQIAREVRKLTKTQPINQWAPFTVEDKSVYGDHKATVIDYSDDLFPK